MSDDPIVGRLAYQQIAERLRDAIHRGELRPGDQLPSRPALVASTGHAGETVKRAIDLLQSEGLVEVVPKRGVFVRDRSRPLIHRRPTRYLRSRRPVGKRPYQAEAEAEGHTADQQVLGIEHVLPAADIASRLLAGEAEWVLRRRHLLLANGIPVSIADAHYRRSLADGTVLERIDRIEHGADVFLADELGIELGRAKEQIRAREATAWERSILKLRDGEPVIRLLVTMFDVDDTPVRVTEWILAGDKHELIYELPVRESDPE